MPQTLFITGATGYIGGSILNAIVTAHPELIVTALMRSHNSEFQSHYPAIKTVFGTFDDFSVIEKATSESDIIVHAGDIDHAGCVDAILSGLALRGGQKKKAFLLHLSGTGCISDQMTSDWTGSYNPRVWNDITDIKEIYDLPDEALHHLLDKKIMDANNEFIKTACIVPSDVYGQSKAIGSRATFMVPFYVSTALKTKEPFYLGKGENVKGVVHVEDISRLFLLLLEHALKDGGEADWGREGFYFALNEKSVQWKQVATKITDILIAHGSLPKGTVPTSWSSEQVGNVIPSWPLLARYLWGSNTQAIAARAQKLGWKPVEAGFWETLEDDIKVVLAQKKEKKLASSM